MEQYKQISNLEPETFADVEDHELNVFKLGFITARGEASEIAINIEARADTFEKLLRKSWAERGFTPKDIDQMIEHIKQKIPLTFTF